MAVAPLSSASLAQRIAAVQTAMPAPINVWHTSAQPPLVMTYQFAAAQPGDLWAQFGGWTALSPAHKAAVASVFAEYAEILNVRFQEVTGAADPDINIGRVALPVGIGGMGGISASYSTSGGQVSSKTLDGYAVFNNTVDIAAAANRNVLLHEIGHAMTLKHPGDYGGGGTPPYLPAAEDNNKYSVMSYNNDPDSGAPSRHLMLYDIAALQARFGANLTTRTGDTIYTGPRDPGADVIWDAGGNDTINASARTVAVKIDLRAGAFSSIGGTDNLAIAYGVTVENATGGAAADTLRGNAGVNSLKGNAGNDILLGDAGSDTLRGDAGADRLDGGGGVDTAIYTERAVAVTVNLATGAGTGGNAQGDTLIAIENVTGGSAADALTGNTAANSLNGWAGKDALNGGGGADRFVFTSTAHSATGANADLIGDFSHAAGDRISMTAIDANLAVAGNQAFAFIGAAGFGGAAGQLRAVAASGKTIVTGDVNGDRVADFQIDLTGTHILVAADFLL